MSGVSYIFGAATCKLELIPGPAMAYVAVRTNCQLWTLPILPVILWILGMVCCYSLISNTGSDGRAF